MHKLGNHECTCKEHRCNLLQMPRSLTGGPIWDQFERYDTRLECGGTDRLEKQLFWQNNFAQWFQLYEMGEVESGGNGCIFDWQLARWFCHIQTLTEARARGWKSHYGWDGVSSGMTDEQPLCEEMLDWMLTFPYYKNVTWVQWRYQM